ncbi:protein of unknown function [Burkholderia multivorans]
MLICRVTWLISRKTRSPGSNPNSLKCASMTLIQGMYGPPLLGWSGVLRRVIASTVLGSRGLRFFGRDLLLASAMINSRLELVVVSGSYGLPPMRPALFCCSEFPAPLPSLRLVEQDDSSDHRRKLFSVQHPTLEKQGFGNSLASLTSRKWGVYQDWPKGIKVKLLGRLIWHQTAALGIRDWPLRVEPVAVRRHRGRPRPADVGGSTRPEAAG